MTVPGMTVFTIVTFMLSHHVMKVLFYLLLVKVGLQQTRRYVNVRCALGSTTASARERVISITEAIFVVGYSDILAAKGDTLFYFIQCFTKLKLAQEN